MDATTIIDTLRPLVAGAALEAAPSVDFPTIVVPRERIAEVCRTLRDTPELGFTYLSDLTAADFHPREPRFEVVYHLVRLGVRDFPAAGDNPAPARVRLKVRVSGDAATLPTVSGVFPNANWSERELFDLFGLVFEGHPDLRRILLPDEWEGHPLRKDYPVQVKVPVQTHETLQLTAEEFAANIDRQRRALGQPPRGDAGARS
jgi:NADH-quinone oxidoreductase subunit C